jgi:5-methylcytosine-specific restriction endonuclease McrBC regulatory subunit McrC
MSPRWRICLQGVPLKPDEEDYPNFDDRAWKSKLKDVNDWLGESLTKNGEATTKYERLSMDLNNSLKVKSGFAGVIRLDDEYTLHIRPKFIKSIEDREWQPTLLGMLITCLKGKFSSYGLEEIHSADWEDFHEVIDKFVDIIADYFAKELEKALEMDSIVMYKTSEIESQFLRGRLLITKQLKTMWSRPGILQCEIDELDTDNHFNQLLHWTVYRLIRICNNNNDIVNRLIVLSERLPPIRGHPQRPSNLDLQVPFQFDHYAEVVKLAVAIEKEEYFKPSVGDEGGYGFVVQTDQLWENFLEICLEAALEDYLSANQMVGQMSLACQYTEGELATSTAKGKAFKTKPDDVILENNQVRLVIDAKNKNMENKKGNIRPIASVMYQMVSTLIAQDCETAVLLYPKQWEDADLPEGDIQEWEVAKSGPPANRSVNLTIAAMTLDISSFSENETIIDSYNKIKQIIQEKIFTKYLQ